MPWMKEKEKKKNKTKRKQRRGSARNSEPQSLSSPPFQKDSYATSNLGSREIREARGKGPAEKLRASWKNAPPFQLVLKEKLNGGPTHFKGHLDIIWNAKT